MSLDLVVLGNLLLDDLVLADGRTRMAEPGGAVLHSALGATLWGLRTGIVTYRGADYPDWPLDALAARGIALDGVHPLGKPGVRAWLLYEGHKRRIVHREDGPTHAEVSPGPERIPAAWRTSRGFHIAPMPLEVQQPLIESLSVLPGAFVSLDPHVPLRADTLDRWRPLVAKVDALFVSEDEMDRGDDPRESLKTLAGGRLRWVAAKRGSRGGLLYDVREARWQEWAPRAVRVVDPTGAGDAFAAGLLAGWFHGDPLERTLARGVVGASFALEDWGTAGLMAASPEMAEARLRQWTQE